MRKIGLFSLLLVLATIACGFFTRGEEDEPGPAPLATDPPRPTEDIEATIALNQQKWLILHNPPSPLRKTRK